MQASPPELAFAPSALCFSQYHTCHRKSDTHSSSRSAYAGTQHTAPTAYSTTHRTINNPIMAQRLAMVLQLLLACLLLQASHAQFTTILSDDSAPADMQQTTSMAAAMASGSNAAAQAIAAAQGNSAAAFAAATASGNQAAAQAAATAMTTSQDNSDILGTSGTTTPSTITSQQDPAAASSQPAVEAAAAPLMPFQPMLRGVPMMQGGFTSILPDGEFGVQGHGRPRPVRSPVSVVDLHGCMGQQPVSPWCVCHSRHLADPCQRH
jgi:hypothetical protein